MERISTAPGSLSAAEPIDDRRADPAATLASFVAVRLASKMRNIQMSQPLNGPPVMDQHFAFIRLLASFGLVSPSLTTPTRRPANGDVGGSSIAGPQTFRGAPRSCSWCRAVALERPRRRRYEEEQMNAEAQARAAPTDRHRQGVGECLFSSMSADERVETIDSPAAASTAGRCGRCRRAPPADLWLRLINSSDFSFIRPTIFSGQRSQRRLLSVAGGRASPLFLIFGDV
jgi:hypothetical protein